MMNSNQKQDSSIIHSSIFICHLFYWLHIFRINSV